MRVALSINDVEDACRAYVGLVWSFLDEFRLDEAEPLMIKALALAEEAEFIGFHAYLQACHGRLELARGHWDDAVAAADLASQSQPASRCAALTVLATVRVRRGEAGATELLEEARRLADQIDELQRIGPVAAARCEHAALRGDSTAVITIAEPVFAEAVRLGDLYLQAELAYWLRKAGRAVDPPDVDHPLCTVGSRRLAGGCAHLPGAWLSLPSGRRTCREPGSRCAPGGVADLGFARCHPARAASESWTAPAWRAERATWSDGRYSGKSSRPYGAGSSRCCGCWPLA